MIHPHPEHPELCYHDCPACRERLPTPFLRGSTPVAMSHPRSHHANCRILIIPGVSARVVGSGERFEEALVRDARRAA